MESEEMNSYFRKVSMPSLDHSSDLLSANIVIIGSSFAAFSAACKFLDEGFSLVLLYPKNSALGVSPSPKVQLFPLFSSPSSKSNAKKISSKSIFDCNDYKLVTEWVHGVSTAENSKFHLQVLDGFIFPFDDSECAYKDYKEEFSLLHLAGYEEVHPSEKNEDENVSQKMKYSNVLQLNPADYLNSITSLVMKKGGRIISCENDVSIYNNIITTETSSIHFDTLLLSKDSLEVEERIQEVIPPFSSPSSSLTLSSPPSSSHSMKVSNSTPSFDLDQYCVMVFEIKKHSLKTTHFYKDCRSCPYYVWIEPGKQTDFLFVKGEKHRVRLFSQSDFSQSCFRMESFVRKTFPAAEKNVFSFTTDVANFDNFYDLESYLKQYSIIEGKKYKFKPGSNFTENILHATFSGLKFVENFVKKEKNENNLSLLTKEKEVKGKDEEEKEGKEDEKEIIMMKKNEFKTSQALLSYMNSSEEIKSKGLNIIDSDDDHTTSYANLLTPNPKLDSSHSQSQSQSQSGFTGLKFPNPLHRTYPNTSQSQFLNNSRMIDQSQSQGQTYLTLNQIPSLTETNNSPKAARTSFPWQHKNTKKTKKMDPSLSPPSPSPAPTPAPAPCTPAPPTPSSFFLSSKTSFKPFSSSFSSLSSSTAYNSSELFKPSSQLAFSETKSEIISMNSMASSDSCLESKSMNDVKNPILTPSPFSSPVLLSSTSPSPSTLLPTQFPSPLTLFPSCYGSSSVPLSSFSVYTSPFYSFSTSMSTASNPSSKINSKNPFYSNTDDSEVILPCPIPSTSNLYASPSMNTESYPLSPPFTSPVLLPSLFPSSHPPFSPAPSPFHSLASSSQSSPSNAIMHTNLSKSDADVSKDFLSLSLQSSPPLSNTVDVDIATDSKDDSTIINAKKTKCELISWDKDRVEILPGYDDCIFYHNAQARKVEMREREETEKEGEGEKGKKYWDESEEEKRISNPPVFDHGHSYSKKIILNSSAKSTPLTFSKQKRIKPDYYEKGNMKWEKKGKQWSEKMNMVEKSNAYSELRDREEKRNRGEYRGRKVGRKPKHFGKEEGEYSLYREEMDKNKLSCVKTCANCSTSRTPLWRNGPAGPKTLCNACGIRYNKSKNGKTKTIYSEHNKSILNETIKKKHFQTHPLQPHSLVKSSSPSSLDKNTEKKNALKRKTHSSHTHKTNSPKSENHLTSDWHNLSPACKKRRRTKRLAVEYDSTTSEEKMNCQNESSEFTHPSSSFGQSMDSKKGKGKVREHLEEIEEKEEDCSEGSYGTCASFREKEIIEGANLLMGLFHGFQ